MFVSIVNSLHESEEREHEDSKPAEKHVCIGRCAKAALL